MKVKSNQLHNDVQPVLAPIFDRCKMLNTPFRIILEESNHKCYEKTYNDFTPTEKLILEMNILTYLAINKMRFAKESITEDLINMFAKDTTVELYMFSDYVIENNYSVWYLQKVSINGLNVKKFI